MAYDRSGSMTGLMRCSKTASSFDQVVHTDGHQPFVERVIMDVGGISPA